jgi:hypothetical protein
MTYVTVNVDADDIIEQLSDDDIKHEYNERNLGGADGYSGWDDREVLTKIWLHDREGRKEEAYALMREYVLDKLNKVI